MTTDQKNAEVIIAMQEKIDRLEAENEQQKAIIATLERLALQGGAGHDAIVKKAVELRAELDKKTKELEETKNLSNARRKWWDVARKHKKILWGILLGYMSDNDIQQALKEN